MSELRPEEVPEEYRELFDFNSQRTDWVGSGKRRALLITRGCIDCDRNYEVIVSQVRANFKRGRKMRGRCIHCHHDGIVTKDGYVWIHKPDHPKAYSGKYVPQHVLVMEESLGRYLDGKNESVHHIDGDKTNNDISNLQLRKKFHGRGQKWACADCGSRNILAVELD